MSAENDSLTDYICTGMLVEDLDIIIELIERTCLQTYISDQDRITLKNALSLIRTVRATNMSMNINQRAAIIKKLEVCE